MKKYLSMAALALMGAMMTGCSNDDNFDNPQQPENKNNVVTLTTTVGLDGGATTRALTSEGVKTFAVNDQIAVIYTKNGGTVTKAVSEKLISTDIASGSKSATFTVTLDDPDKTKNVTYIYPAAMADEMGVDLTKLNTQEGTFEALQSKYDLCTKSGAWDAGNLPSLTLENQLAILAITLKDNAATPTEITSITSLTISDGTNTYTVSRSAAAGPIYVAIRPTASAAIDVTATNGTNYYIKSLTGKTYAQNNGYNVSWRMTELSEGTLPGKFTINAGGNKVRFSKGNLQAVFASAGSSCTWQFATNQWDYIGSAAANTSINDSGSVSVAGTVDLFGWVGTSSSSGNNYGIWNNTTANDYGNTKNESLKYDWGHNAITNGGNTADMWRTLTREEWGYMLSTRSGATVNGTNNVRFAKATIRTDATGVKGLLLFPDGATFDASEASWGVLDNGYENYTTTCTAAQWTALEAKGCVFLPAAGNRTGTTVSDAGNAGAYWSATGSDSKASDIYPYSYRVSFGQTSWSNPQYYAQQQKTYGHSVRLVRAVE